MRFLLLFLLACTTTIFSQENVFTNMNVFELEWVNKPSISPDGKRIIYERGSMDIMKDRRTSRLWVINTDGTEHRKFTSNDQRESNATWSPSGDRVAYTTATNQGSEIFVYWVESKVSARLTQLEYSPSSLQWSPDGKHLSFSMFVPKSSLKLSSPPKKPKGAKWANPVRVVTSLRHEADGSGVLRPGHRHLFIIPAIGGSPKQVSHGDFNHRSAIWSKDGKQLLFSSNRNSDWEYDFRNSEIYALTIASGNIKQLTDRKGPDYAPSISPNGKKIAYLGYLNKTQTYQITRLYIMNSDGSNQKEIDTQLDRSIKNIQWDASGKGLYFMFDDKGSTKIGYTTLAGKTSTIATNIGGASVARPYGGGSYSLSKNGIIATHQTTPSYPAELAVVHPNKKAKLLTQLNEDVLAQKTLGNVEEVWYKSSFDNRDIQGWIVTPPYFDATKKYPLLVENHGGPISNYGNRFSPEMQLYATAGFVVFYPNPRGSTSYGEEFGNLLYHNYPGNDYDDVMSGVDFLIAKGWVDKNQLFVTGGSAGGIMSAWMIGKNNRFKAAAVVKPVMNWISKTLSADNYYMYANSRFPGQPWENPETYMKFSPVSLVGNIQTPTLVMVGEKDLRTPISEAKQLYSALKIRKIETALVVVPGAYHFIANRPSQLIAKIDNILGWFEKYRE